MKKSPCCNADIEKKKRYSGQVTLDYCKKCHRRVWSGKKTVTRIEANKQEEKVLNKKVNRAKQEKLYDAFMAIILEKDSHA